ncbi:unnamed protein product [Moneuplotes crassus]|uniref:Uncharacterized protein n=1 Tax=Euplotes crassus TaxID=5936 RepID=A0AAD1U6P4_EUPCR|nr:unnamed protein product [Moneuplotes crassus]
MDYPAESECISIQSCNMIENTYPYEYSCHKNQNKLFQTIESSEDKDQEHPNGSCQSKDTDGIEENTGTFQSLRESLLGVPSNQKDSSTVKKIRERIHMNMIKKTPSPLGKALLTLTTESSKENFEIIPQESLQNYYQNIDDTKSNLMKDNILEANFYFANNSELNSQRDSRRSQNSDIKVKDYFQQDEEESQPSQIRLDTNLFSTLQDENLCNFQESQSSLQSKDSVIIEEGTSKEQSNKTPESVQKQSDRLVLSPSDLLSHEESMNQPQETSYSTEILPIEIDWKYVKFSENISEYCYPKLEFIDPESPITALHHIRHNKGVAWLKACERVKRKVRSNAYIRKRLSLSKLDMLLEREYMEEVRTIYLKEIKDDEKKIIEDKLDCLNRENEVLRKEVNFLNERSMEIHQTRDKLIESSHFGLDRTLNEADKNITLLTFAQDDNVCSSGFHNISSIPVEKDHLIFRSLEDQELTAAIVETQEEDEDSSSQDDYCQINSKSLKFESLTNESTCYRSNMKSALKSSNISCENFNPRLVFSKGNSLQESTQAGLTDRLSECKSEIKLVMLKRKRARMMYSRDN